MGQAVRSVPGVGTVEPGHMNGPAPPPFAWLELASRYCEAAGVSLTPPRLAALAVLNARGLPMTADGVLAGLKQTEGPPISRDAISRALRGLWEIGLIVRLDRVHGYVARPPRAPELGLLLCEQCGEAELARHDCAALSVDE